MDLVGIYDTLRSEVKQRTDGFSPDRSYASTTWQDGEDPLTGPDEYKVRVNNEDLADDLDDYEDLLEDFNVLSKAVQDTVSAAAPNYLHDDRYATTSLDDVVLNAEGTVPQTSYDDRVRLQRWVLPNSDAIATADTPDELRYLLEENSDTCGWEFEAVYSTLDDQDHEGEAGNDTWYEELWDLISQDSLIEFDGEQYTIQEALQERQDVNDRIAETAADLEGRLDQSMRDELKQYRPGLTTRAARLVRNLRS